MLEESSAALASSVGTTDGGSIPSSPEDTGNWHRSLQIDMKGLVGDAVGNVRPYTFQLEPVSAIYATFPLRRVC